MPRAVYLKPTDLARPSAAAHQLSEQWRCSPRLSQPGPTFRAQPRRMALPAC